MALSTNIYAEVTTTFPAGVIGVGGIDITKSGGVYTFTFNGSSIAVNSIGNDKLSQVTGARLIGNPTGATADRSEISLGSDLEFSGTSLRGAALTGDVTKSAGSTTTSISVGAVGTAEIATDAVTSNEIALGAVGSSEIATGAVGADEISAGAVGTSELAAGAVTGAELANDSVNSEHYVAASIDHEHLAEDIITGATDRTAFASGDKLLIHETGVGLRRIDYDDLPAGGGSVADGQILQSGYDAFTTHSTGHTNGIPLDATVPQITEGIELCSVTLTPSSTTNKFRIRYGCNLGVTTASWIIAAVWESGTNDAKSSALDYLEQATASLFLSSECEYVPGVTTAVTIKFRAGAQSGKTFFFNGDNGTNYLGGTCRAFLSVEEIKAS